MTYTRLDWFVGIVLAFSATAAVVILMALPLIVYSSLDSTSQEIERKRMSNALPALIAIWVGLIVVTWLCYHYTAVNLVTVRPEGFSVRYMVLSDVDLRYEDLDSLQAVSTAGAYASSGTDVLFATTKLDAEKQRADRKYSFTKQTIYFSGALNAALPDIFRRAQAKGVQCEDKRW